MQGGQGAGRGHQDRAEVQSPVSSAVGNVLLHLGKAGFSAVGSPHLGLLRWRPQ